VAYALALLAAVSFGTADFLGGLASRQTSAMLVTVASQCAGFLVLLPVVMLQPALPDRASFVWGAAAGLAGCAGLIVFFRVLAAGNMSLAAPVTAVVSASLPVVVGVALGERPAVRAWAGVAVGLFAVAAVSWHGRGVPGRERYRSAALAVLAGAGFGVFFICLSRTSPAAGLWPLVGARMSSLTLLVIAVAATRAEWRAKPGALRTAFLSGALDMAANVLFVLAVHRGALALVAVLVSLYPAATVVLAMAVLRERLQSWQLAGVVLALTAVGLIASA
jgi:drug/metabolite transporter (DMT)-like permease